MSFSDFDIWMFVAGLGIFLFGMYHLENGLNGLAGKSFKTLLSRFTRKSWSGILMGASLTAILQSSSLVTLLVVAFLGAGMISLHNSLGVVLGANLGTTATAWIVATLGFKISVASLSFPFLAIGILTYLFMESRPGLRHMGSFLIGFGLLFLGLDYMKLSIEGLAGQIDLNEYANLGLWVFIVIGVVVTALIQSSSAMIVIVLSTLNAGIIDIYQASCLVIGSNIGTTSTLFIASIKGTPDKKRLALANIIFNIMAGSIAFFSLTYLIRAIVHYLNIADTLMQLVLFNTVLNLIAIIVFYPLLKPLGKLLARVFKKTKEEDGCMYIAGVSTEVTSVALEALDKELDHIFYLTQDFILDCLRYKEEYRRQTVPFLVKFIRAEKNPLTKYNSLKKMQDEVTLFYKSIQLNELSESESELLMRYMNRLRSMAYSAKNIKDIIENIREIESSEDKLALKVLKKLQKFSLIQMNLFRDHMVSNGRIPINTDWEMELSMFYQDTIAYLYRKIGPEQERDIPVSTLNNVIKKTMQCLEELANSVDTEIELV
jgi:phosphate:Na+ symporter